MTWTKFTCFTKYKKDKVPTPQELRVDSGPLASRVKEYKYCFASANVQTLLY
jgi:hypothetical protein